MPQSGDSQSWVPTVGIIANPVSGRDIRRVAARGGVSSSQDKQNRIARAVIGAVTAGAQRVLAMQEPFGIASGALADLDVDAELRVIDIGATVSPTDTQRAAQAMRDEGVDVLITLGGDGTNRTIAQVWSDAVLVPMSTGTNNVFPSMVEPTIAGAAAGLIATGKVALEAAAPRSKVVRIDLGELGDDLALIDAISLVNDFVGNKMPVDPEKIRSLVLTTARPDTIGVSSIGGLIQTVLPADDFGLLVECGHGGSIVTAPIAPGLYRQVPVLSTRRIALDEPIEIHGPSTLAFDGDRERKITDVPAILRIRRDGPRVVDVPRTLSLGQSHFRTAPVV
ncbi:MAG: putative polyphosphate/ATP-dependent NAD kinase [Candidatus Poriferisodalaceae bacterium]